MFKRSISADAEEDEEVGREATALEGVVTVVELCARGLSPDGVIVDFVVVEVNENAGGMQRTPTVPLTMFWQRVVVAVTQ